MRAWQSSPTADAPPWPTRSAWARPGLVPSQSAKVRMGTCPFSRLPGLAPRAALYVGPAPAGGQATVGRGRRHSQQLGFHFGVEDHLAVPLQLGLLTTIDVRAMLRIDHDQCLGRSVVLSGVGAVASKSGRSLFQLVTGRRQRVSPRCLDNPPGACTAVTACRHGPPISGARANFHVLARASGRTLNPLKERNYDVSSPG